MAIGKLDKKVVLSKETEKELRWEYGFSADKFKYGDNVYSVIRFSGGNPYNTYNILMSRDEIVDCFKAGEIIIGLKIDKAGHLIEDSNALNPNAKELEIIKKHIIESAINRQYSLDLEEDEERYGTIERVAKVILMNGSNEPDHWEVHDLILGIAKEVATEQKLFIGAAYVSDDMHDFCISKKYENVISHLACSHVEYISNQRYDNKVVGDRLKRALVSEKCLEPWIESGNVDLGSLYDTALMLEQAGEVGESPYYGQVGIWYSEPLSRAIKAIVERAKSDFLDYELKTLMKNIKVFRSCRFKANNPQETFKLYTKRAMLGHGNSTQSISDYIDLALAIQEIYYKNPENIRCDEEGVIIIDKAGIKIERKPYILTVSKI